MATIYHEVWIDAPISRVYGALSSAEGVSSWWDKQTPKETDAGLVLEHSPGPEHGTVQMKVLERVPDQLVRWECTSTHPPTTPAYAWTGTHLSFDLGVREDHPPALARWARDVPAQTILQFKHSDWDETSDYFGFCNFAWGVVLNNLKAVCES